MDKELPDVSPSWWDNEYEGVYSNDPENGYAMISAIKFKSRLLLIVCLFACFVGCETYNHKIKVTRPDGHEQIISITSLHQKPKIYPNTSGNLRVSGSEYFAPIGWNIDIIMEAEKE